MPSIVCYPYGLLWCYRYWLVNRGEFPSLFTFCLNICVYVQDHFPVIVYKSWIGKTNKSIKPNYLSLNKDLMLLTVWIVTVLSG